MSIRLLPIVLHSASASVMIWGYNQLSTLSNDGPIRSQVGGHFQYLTIQCLAAACATMLLGLSADLFPFPTGFRRVQRSLMMICLPLSTVVALIYWSLLLIDPALILLRVPNTEPSSSSAAPELVWIPLKHDLALHATPAASLLIDFIMFHEPYSSDEANYGASTMTTVAGIWYALWVEYCASHNKMFPYPFLTIIPRNARIGIYVMATILGLISFRIINTLHPRRTVKRDNTLSD